MSFANDVAVDSLNNVYYCGYSQMAGNNGPIIVKYNNSGTLQWQRLLKDTTGISCAFKRSRG